MLWAVPSITFVRKSLIFRSVAMVMKKLGFLGKDRWLKSSHSFVS